MADNDTEGSSLVVKQDNINEISKTSSDLEIQDTIDLHRMVGTTYNKPVKVGITLPGSLIKQTDMAMFQEVHISAGQSRK
jgi:hypothetical protein